MNPLHAIPMPVPVPVPDSAAALHAARALRRQRHLLSALQALHEQLGDVFRLPLPGFSSVVLVGPDANRFLLLEARGSVRWRAETDPVTRLLEHGILVTDGAVHDELRQAMSSNFHKTMLEGYLGTMWRMTDRVADEWGEGSRVDLFAQMRRVALLILTDTLFNDDFGAPMDLLWHDIVRTLHYIAPGPWLLWPGVPRPGYRRARQRLDAYLFGLIARRRTHPRATDDLPGSLIAAGLRDDVIRDQLLTMFIAGHDTSTALLAWTLYLLLRHPEALARVQSEIDAVIGAFPPAQAHLRQLRYLDRVVKETLRLYPPIHLGSRIATDDVVFQKYQIAAGTRILYSPYLTHHDARVWPAAEQFDPDRFAPEHAHERPPYAFLPFGGGPRNCMGAAFAQVEAKIVLARLLQRYELRFVGGTVRPRMRATLEPSPGVLVEVRRRSLPNGQAV